MRHWWEYVTDLDPHGAMWHEAEFHQSGQVHGHALLKFGATAPVLSFRHKWYELAGYCDVEPVLAVAQAAAYITKRCGVYVTKHPTIEPLVRGVRVRSAFGRRGDA
jgi:hypothetical protein